MPWVICSCTIIITGNCVLLHDGMAWWWISISQTFTARGTANHIPLSRSLGGGTYRYVELLRGSLTSSPKVIWGVEAARPGVSCLSVRASSATGGVFSSP